jgi:hypothetical protein
VHQGWFVRVKLNIGEFCQRKITITKTKKLSEIGASFWYCWKAVDELDFLETISEILDLRLGNY